MTDTNATVFDSDRAELVAYLDGELDEAATIRMERRLAEDAAVRREVEMLSRTFELLDELPQQRASGEFTQRTVATACVSQANGKSAGRRWPPHLRRVAVAAGCVAALFVSAALGYLAANRTAPDETQMLVEELPVIRKVHVYRDVDSVRYVRKLQESRFFDDDPEAEQP